MSVEKLLRVIFDQRHCYLNHLQVISGFLQLDKIDKAREYINRVSAELALLAGAAKIKIPEVSAALIVAVNEALGYHVDVELAVETDLDRCSVPGNEAGLALERCLNCAVSTLERAQTPSKRLKITAAEGRASYSFRIHFLEEYPADPAYMERELAAAADALAPYGGRVNLATANGGVEIFMTLPIRDAGKEV